VRTASVVTMEPSSMLVIHKADYGRILKSTHEEVSKLLPKPMTHFCVHPSWSLSWCIIQH